MFGRAVAARRSSGRARTGPRAASACGSVRSAGARRESRRRVASKAVIVPQCAATTMRSIESARAACRARELAVAPIEALDLRRAAPRADPELSMTSSAPPSRSARGSCVAMILRTSSAGKSAAQLNASHLLLLGTVDDQHARHALAQSAALEQQRDDENAVRPGAGHAIASSSRAAISGCSSCSRSRRNAGSSNARRRSAARSSSPSAPTKDAPSDSTTARWPGFAAPADRVRDVVGVEDVRAAARRTRPPPPICRCRCRR